MPQAKPTITLRRPSAPVPLSVAESFVRGEGESLGLAQVPGPSADIAPPEPAVDPTSEGAESLDVQAPGRPDIQPLRPGIVQRRSGRVRRRTTVYLEPALATRLAIHCATYGLEISQVAEAAILDHLNALGRRPVRPTQESSAAG